MLSSEAPKQFNQTHFLRRRPPPLLPPSFSPGPSPSSFCEALPATVIPHPFENLPSELFADPEQLTPDQDGEALAFTHPLDLSMHVMNLILQAIEFGALDQFIFPSYEFFLSNIERDLILIHSRFDLPP
jgi:hypothetical protein